MGLRFSYIRISSSYYCTNSWYLFRYLKKKENFFYKRKPVNFKPYPWPRSQDLKEIICDAGQFYWGRSEAWLKLKPIINKSSTIINIPRWRAHDIDTLEDWKQAEIIYKSLMKKKYD